MVKLRHVNAPAQRQLPGARHRGVSSMPKQRNTVMVPCVQCGISFEVWPSRLRRSAVKFCSEQCRRDNLDQRPSGERFDRAAWLEVTRQRNRAFVTETNARTFCAHCGAQPVEWHNPAHVAGRQFRRVSSMIYWARVEEIQSEMDQCTPLCRGCHMREDGRMSNLLVGAPVRPPKPCDDCARFAKPLRRGLCGRCYARRRVEVSASS